MNAHDRLEGRAAYDAIKAAMEGFAALEYAWGKYGRGLPLRPDSHSFVAELLSVPDPIVWRGLMVSYMSRHGTPIFEFRGPNHRLLVFRFPCYGVVEYSAEARAIPGRADHERGGTEGTIQGTPEQAAEGIGEWFRWLYKPAKNEHLPRDLHFYKQDFRREITKKIEERRRASDLHD